jgi:AAA15 family ATPase/GTPase
MELCYIWVFSFRSFKNQGFSFTTRFNVSYDHEENRIHIALGFPFIKDFFGKQIRNVTGIVGENAAGKTNLLELINYLS